MAGRQSVHHLTIISTTAIVGVNNYIMTIMTVTLTMIYVFGQLCQSEIFNRTSGHVESNNEL